ncbi:MAG: outer membrane lipid asymmetry maintenance protein MlaD [Betaproteobacteria bacterium RBG_16_58_11]|nr:MAG: outer membrane lipid asymmetry maintenance protein MlaD [Betaproteobacteria bacterium RBG_16_58_11]
MERKTLDLWVGLFVVAGLAAVLVLAMKVGNLSTFNMSESYALQADFDNIGGLKARAPVKSAGVVVGRVTGITFDNASYRARVSMVVDKRYQFPKDTFAKILTAGLLGEQYIGLDPGGDEVNLKSGDKIAKTEPAMVLESLISKFMFDKAADGDTAKK